jgi:SAM-dependent methyltransferase
MKISFEALDDCRAWEKAPDFLKSLIGEHGCQRILEVGSGANPTLDPEYVRLSGLEYVTSDVNADELAKADLAFERLVIDLSAEVPESLLGSFDCVFSRLVGEHIRDGEKYHRNLFEVLRPGGISVHCFSSLWTIPFAVNRLLPDSLTDPLLKFVSPRDSHKQGKFKAYYSWSRGPTKTMINRFHSLGFEVIEYIGCFGHAYYRKRFPWLDRLERMKTRFLLQHPVPLLCSYATIILRKPK